jgi:hypothetical protein
MPRETPFKARIYGDVKLKEEDYDYLKHCKLEFG